MIIFIERFLLAILAALAVLLGVTNPMGFSGTVRIIGVIIIFILAAIAACYAGKYNRPAPVSYQTPRPYSTPERNYVDVKPRYLAAFFKSHTAIQAAEMVAVYIGSWIRLSGSVGNVMKNGPTRWQLTFTSRFSLLRVQEPTVFMYFVGERWATRLATLRPGDKVIVDGRIREVDTLAVHLEDCEFVD
jgi:hypothetical protein